MVHDGSTGGRPADATSLRSTLARFQPVLEGWLAALRGRLETLPGPERERLRSETEHLVDRTLEELHVIESALLDEGDALAAAAEQAPYRRLFEGAPVGLLVTDLDGCVREANATFAAVVRRPPERLRGLPLAAMIALDDRRPLRAALVRMGRERGPFELPLALLRADGVRLELGATVRVEDPDAPPRARRLYWAVSDDRRGAADLL